jgi:hypothetical protein
LAGGSHLCAGIAVLTQPPPLPPSLRHRQELERDLLPQLEARCAEGQAAESASELQLFNWDLMRSIDAATEWRQVQEVRRLPVVAAHLPPICRACGCSAALLGW